MGKTVKVAAVQAKRRTISYKVPTAEEALFRPRWVPNLAEAETQLTFESERRFVRRAWANPRA